MVRLWVLGLVSLYASAGVAQSSAPAASSPSTAPTKISCKIDRQPPTQGETEYNRKDFTEAEKTFRAALATDPHDSVAREGLVRTLIEEDKVTEAGTEADKWLADEPGKSMALTASGEVQLRRGQPNDAYATLTKALMTDLCNARAFYEHAQIESLAGLHASAKQSIQRAYALHPTDDDIHTSWISTRSRNERLALWADYANHSEEISDKDRSDLKERLAKESLYHPSDCKISSSSPTTTKAPIVPIMNGPTNFVGWGLDLKFNGKTRRLQIDTGASGIIISRAAALFLGIDRQDSTQIAGIGDKAKPTTSIAHVASIRIGDIELQNCAVEIIEKWSVLDSDGLIGADVFANSVVTLDFPKKELRLSPLPPRPDDPKTPPSDDEEPQPHDPYIAPEMAKWTKIYRSGHDLIMPSWIVQTKQAKDNSAWRSKLFILDTGSFDTLISPTAAREITKVSRDETITVQGLQGQVEKVFEAGNLTMQFANLEMAAPSMTAIDMTKLSHDSGMEISGLIGAPALFQLVMHIDYRDNLVWCEYTPKK